MDIRTRAYALYSMAMAGYGDKENAIALMDESLTYLDPFSQAALALTLHQLEESGRAEEILNLLEQSASQVGEQSYWPQSTYDGEYRRKTMASTVRATAMVLAALMEIQGNSDLADSTANYLIEHRTGHGWGTTNETSFTILALTDYLAGQQEFSGVSNYVVNLNGSNFTEGVLGSGNLFTTISIPVEDLSAGLNSIQLATSGTDPLYYDVITSYITPKQSTAAAGPILISREYLDPKTNKPLEAIIEGQLVKVKLTLNIPVHSSFMILEDHLPGGLEALNTGLSSTTQEIVQYESAYSDYYEETFRWQDNGYNYKEIHGDRVSFFITEMAKGSRSFVYFARATSTGTFTALPAEAYAMYNESIWGRSASTSVEIEPR
jgi:uncharacterized protein YfaS (alpha-2-macroglobulin family)